MRLKDEHRAWLVAKFATYGRLLEVLHAFRDEFGFEIDKRQAAKYDLSNASTKPGTVEKWRPIWDKARADFEASVTNIPVASATFRVKKLDEMFTIAFERRNYKTAAQLLEQAAKETGGMFSNKRHIEGAIEHNHTHEEVPDEVKRSALAARIREAVADAMSVAQAAADEASTAQPTTH